MYQLRCFVAVADELHFISQVAEEKQTFVNLVAATVGLAGLRARWRFDLANHIAGGGKESRGRAWTSRKGALEPLHLCRQHASSV